jgi:hypothetical protein
LPPNPHFTYFALLNFSASKDRFVKTRLTEPTQFGIKVRLNDVPAFAHAVFSHFYLYPPKLTCPKE